MIKYLAGPIIGMIIGYCTNYIAVKMLFRPRTEKYLFGHRLPLTPGAIPKGKSRLAAATGEVVAKYLVTEEDIVDGLLSQETENAIVDKVMDVMTWELRQDLSVIAGSGENYEIITGRINDITTEKIVDAVSEIDIAGFVGEEGKRIIIELMAGTMFGMFINEATIDQIIGAFGAELARVARERGDEFIRPVVTAKMSELRDSTILDLLGSAGIDEVRVREIVTSAYRSAVNAGVSRMLVQIDIAGMIESKINAMSSEELEVLVLSVMKKELNTIVNLGALIGFMLGLLNILF